ncbi:MAG: class I SAM-dependent methyltransferase [Bacteroidales bacterium]|jgi:SAM-dependent methyltransferase|nr:class I SAM-dependent methyltransferase [Bacteroidales bacterium]
MKKGRIFRTLLQPIWKAWYEYVSRKDSQGEIKFLNYGFHSDEKVNLSPEDETERYPLQLYHHIASAVDISDKAILEVGCGRGGGASYISRYFKPKSYVAVDISHQAINYCNGNHTTAGLDFVQGDAQKLPFEQNSFDTVINVESSHCYPNLSIFFDEVYKALKPNGYFLYTDFRNQKNLSQVEETIKQSKFEIISLEDITGNVAKALEVDNERRVNLIKRLVPSLFFRPVSAFAATTGSGTYKDFASKWNTYYFYVLKK